MIIRIEQNENSPDLCEVRIDRGWACDAWFDLSLAEAIELRNKLTEAINIYQAPVLNKHISNAGQQSEK